MVSKRQTLISEPDNVPIKNARLRRIGRETLETRPITQIVLIQKGTRREEYLVTVEDGTTHRLKSIGQNPKFLVFYNDEPLATCRSG